MEPNNNNSNKGMFNFKAENVEQSAFVEQPEEKRDNNQQQQLFKLEEIEGHNQNLIKEEIERQYKVKLGKVQEEREMYEQKLGEAEALVEAELKKEKVVPAKSRTMLKDLENKISFYKNRLDTLGSKEKKLAMDYENGIEGEVLALEKEDSFFSFGVKKHNVEKTQQRSLIELTVDGTEKFLVSEFFYNLLFKHQTEAL